MTRRLKKRFGGVGLVFVLNQTYVCSVLSTRLRAMFLVGLGAILIAVPAFVSMRAEAAPSPALLTFDGIHIADANPNMRAGVRHEGRFTAAPPFCASGTAVDVLHKTVMPLRLYRVHTCDDGTGSFTVFFDEAAKEHPAEPEARGPWLITEGTGRYATLRGRGYFTGRLVTGDFRVPLTTTYRTVWDGVVDFDASGPNTTFLTAKATKLRRGTYALRLALDLRDTPGTPVSYQVTVKAGGTPLADREGATSTGLVSMSLRIRPSKATHSVRIHLSVSDQLGNTASKAHAVTIPR